MARFIMGDSEKAREMWKEGIKQIDMIRRIGVYGDVGGTKLYIEDQKRQAETCPIIHRSIPGHIHVGFPRSVFMSDANRESDYAINQLLGAEAIAGKNNEEERIDGLINFITRNFLIALNEESEFYMNPDTSSEDILKRGLERLNSPDDLWIPIIQFESKRTKLKWLLTFVGAESSTSPVVPAVIIPYFGNMMVLMVPDPASHAVACGMQPLEHFDAAVKVASDARDEITRDIKNSDEELANRLQNLDIGIAYRIKADFVPLIKDYHTPFVASKICQILWAIYVPILNILFEATENQTTKEMLNKMLNIMGGCIDKYIKILTPGL